MVDDATLTLLATFVQTIVITLTLIIFIFQFRSQEKAIKESSYQNLLGRYNDFIMSSGLGDETLYARLISSTGQKIEGQDLATFRRLMISYGIIEEAFELHQKGWIDDESWEQWNTWLKVMCRLPLFATLHSLTTGMFDKAFQAHVSKILEANQGTSTTA